MMEFEENQQLLALSLVGGDPVRLKELSDCTIYDFFFSLNLRIKHGRRNNQFPGQTDRSNRHY